VWSERRPTHDLEVRNLLGSFVFQGRRTHTRSSNPHQPSHNTVKMPFAWKAAGIT
jgi:hypothetical protein